jgi:CBS domain-containing protein
MSDRNVGAVLVLDQAGAIQGLFSERDFVRKIIIKERTMESTRVKEIMTTRVLYVKPDTTRSDCMELMTENASATSPSSRATSPSVLSPSGTWSRLCCVSRNCS